MTRTLPAVALAALIVLSGCMTASVDATVGGDGTVTSYDLSLQMSPTVYDGLQAQAEDSGYDSVEGYLLSDVNTSRMANHTYEQSLDGDNVTINVSFTDWNPGPESAVSTNVSDGNVTFEDRTFVTVQENDGAALGDGVAVRYELTMPADITESNADLVRNDTAVWEYAADEPVEEPMRATSLAPSGVFGPGFGVTAAVLALLSMGVLARRS
ncbi:PGF-CTERM sorting domain-containing protein [Haloarcula salina]|uniref:PGF-CTERM sorting domain-containing protein n=1 Tax=Haloarcula salina TaxID=1429914 RepID=UPI003C700AD7